MKLVSEVSMPYDVFSSTQYCGLLIIGRDLIKKKTKTV